VLSQGNRDAAAVPFGLKFTDNIHYKFKSIAKLRKPGFIAPDITGAKQNLMQNGHSRSFKVTCFVERRQVTKYGCCIFCWLYLLRFRRYSDHNFLSTKDPQS